jgi:pimeloyl-ACP methyl ester carboxylesterase
VTAATGADGIVARRVAVVTEHTATLGDQPVFWRAAADDPANPPEAPVLYLHGVPTASDQWLRFLARTGGLAPDLPGFGCSGKRGDGDFTIEGYAGFVGDFLDLVEVDRIRLVVHDWGAAGLVWAQRNPERVERLVILDSVPLLEGYRWHRIARAWRTRALGEMLMGATTRFALRRTMPPALADAVWPYFDQGTQRAILRLYRTSPEERLAEAGRDLHRIDCPALVLWGDRDPYIPPRFADAYAAALGGDARAEHLPDAGHWAWYDSSDVVDRVATFLARTRP